MEDKRFYRSNQHRIIGGVCGGLGNYFGIDPVIMRVIFFILAFAGGGGVLIYIILWILVPEEPVLFGRNTQSSKKNHHSQTDPNPYNTENMNAENVNFEEMGNDNPHSDINKKNDNAPQKNHDKNNGALIAGIMLIVLGCMFLIDNFIPGINFGNLWPLILVAIGVILIYENYKDKPVKK